MDATYTKDDQYVVVMSLDAEGSALTTEQAEKAVSLMEEAGWDVEIREPRRGEAEGTYAWYRGSLQILGYSISVPEELEADLNRAMDLAIR